MNRRYANVGSRIVVAAFLCAMPMTAGAAVTNIIPEVDLGDAAVAGQWKKNAGNDAVRCRDTDLALFRLPAAPEGEFNVRIEFKRLHGDGPIGVIVPWGESSFSYMIGGSIGEGTDGFALAGGGATGQNAVRGDKAGASLESNTDMKIVVKVRAESVEACVNGKRVAVHNAEDGDLAIAGGADVGEGALGLIAMKADVVFSQIRIKTVPVKAPAPVKTEDDKKDDKPAAPINLDRGTKWGGGFTTSLNQRGTGYMKITARRGNTFEAVVGSGCRLRYRIAFVIKGDKMVLIDAVDESKVGFRKMLGGDIGIDGDRLQLRLDYELNIGKRRNQSASAYFDLYRR
ncbi:MAG: hypothetical protein H6819_04120 [Phycisphaerales bacterium]|nr:hypothetical protein [Phycisphaerales bacterium]MCB9856385.1 hypothetical protein [Phycisphaerales bacterium]